MRRETNITEPIRQKYFTFVVRVSVEPLDLLEAEEESHSLILGGLRTEEAGGLKTLTAQGDLEEETVLSWRLR